MGLSTQITIRLSDESVAFIDGLVQEGAATSRATAIDKIVRRQRRRAAAEEDLKRILAIPETAEEREFREWATPRSPMMVEEG